MSWTVDVDPRSPVRILTRIGNVASEFPGDDDFHLLIGRRTVTLNVSDCPELRDAIERVLPQP